MRIEESYSMACAGCGREVEIPAHDGVQACPRCGVRLIVDWAGSRRDYAADGEGARPTGCMCGAEVCQ